MKDKEYGAFREVKELAWQRRVRDGVEWDEWLSQIILRIVYTMMMMKVKNS